MTEVVDIPAFRARQAAAREEGRYLGLGLATYIEGAPGPRGPSGGLGNETMRMRLEDDGTFPTVGEGSELADLGQPDGDLQVRRKRGGRDHEARLAAGDLDRTTLFGADEDGAGLAPVVATTNHQDRGQDDASHRLPPMGRSMGDLRRASVHMIDIRL